MGESVSKELTAPALNFDDMQGDPATMPTIVEHCAQGGSLIELCKTWGVSFARVMRWIRADKERSKVYSEALTDRNEWLKEAVLLELRSLSLADIREAFDSTGRMKHPNEWPDSLARAVAGFEIFEEFTGKGEDRTYIGDTKKLKLWDKKGSLELIGKTMALFIEKNVHTIEKSLEDLVLESYGGNVNGERSVEDGGAVSEASNDETEKAKA